MKYIIRGQDKDSELEIRLDNADGDANLEVWLDNKWERIAYVAYYDGQHTVTVSSELPPGFRKAR